MKIGHNQIYEISKLKNARKGHRNLRNYEEHVHLNKYIKQTI